MYNVVLFFVENHNEHPGENIDHNKTNPKQVYLMFNYIYSRIYFCTTRELHYNKIFK